MLASSMHLEPTAGTRAKPETSPPPDMRRATIVKNVSKRSCKPEQIKSLTADHDRTIQDA
jgi:hypothetical protein